MVNPDEVKATLQRAYALIKEEKFSDARQILKDVIAQDPRNADAYFLWSYTTANRDEQIKAIDRALQANPQHARALDRKAKLGALPALSQQPRPVQTAPSRPTEVLPAKSTSVEPAALPPAPRPQPAISSAIPSAAPAAKSPASRTPVIVGIAVVCVVAIVGLVVILSRGSAGATPEGTLSQIINAARSNDNNTFAALLDEQYKALAVLVCGDQPILDCFNRSEKPLFMQAASFNTQLISATEEQAQVMLRFPDPAGGGEICQRFPLRRKDGKWLVSSFEDKPRRCDDNSAIAAAPTNAPATAIPTATPDETEIAVRQTATMLANTADAMRIAPTLTATFLAPGFTQTALVRIGQQQATQIAATATTEVIRTQQALTQTAQANLQEETRAAITATADAKLNLTATSKALLASFTGRIAFSIGGNLYITNPDGSGVNKLKIEGEYPQWSPDGTQILFSNERRLYLVNADGSNKRLWLDPRKVAVGDIKAGNLSSAGWAAWSPDGKQIAVTLYDSPRDARVYLASADGTNIRPLSLPGGSSAAWSPDGSRIVYTRDGFLHLINVDGSGEQKLAPDDLKCFDARWSPDGRQIACQSGNSARARAVVVNVDGSGYTYLTPEGRASGKPAWSPDGRYLVLAVSSSGGWRLHITDPAATFLINIQHMNGDSSISWTK